MFRYPSTRVNIKELYNSHYIETEDKQKSNYFLTYTGEKIYRVKIIATIISIPTINTTKNYSKILIDDNTEIIWAYAFNKINTLQKKVQIGDLVQIIAKPRKWNNEISLVTETICKIDPRMISLSKLEIIYRKLTNNNNYQKAIDIINTSSCEKQALEKASKNNISKSQIYGIYELYNLIKKMKQKQINSNKIDILVDEVYKKIEEEKKIDIDILIAEFKSNYSTADVEESLKILLSDGKIFEPNVGIYSIT